MHPSAAGSGVSSFPTSSSSHSPPLVSSPSATVTATTPATAPFGGANGTTPSSANAGPVSPSENEESGLPHKRPGSSHDDTGLSPDNGAGCGAGVVEDQRTKKRKVGGPGSRGVANLTPEQLAKKRANDREAQRAIRERTKNQIEALEKRIQELTSQKPYQELQAVIQAKEAVEAENAEIKSRLAAIMSMIQPVLSGQQGLEGVYSTPPLSNITSITPTPTQPIQRSPSLATSAAYNVATPPSTASPVSTMADPSWQNQATQPSPQFTQVKLINQQRQNLLHSLDLGAGEQLKLDFLLDPSAQVSRIQTGVDGPQDTPEYHHLPMKHDWNANANAGNQNPTPSRNNSITKNEIPQQQQQQHQQHRIEYAPHQPIADPTTSWIGHAAPLKNSAPTCPLDNLLLDFLSERRQRAYEGVPPREIIGPRYPSVSSLLNPSQSAFSHPLSKVFTDILAAFPGISTLPERVAVLYYMFLMMRWQVSPTRGNYDLLPAFARPTPAQLRTPHPAWIDHLPFPLMRERLSLTYAAEDGAGRLCFDDFFIPFTTTVSLNWPYEDTDALLRAPGGGGELLINPVFERHLRRFENWTLGEAFDAAFPRLRGTYNLKVGTRTREVGGGGG
ncbi:hypothetical protein F5B19DRAFT_450483 [Rostrohypoxylon terebratum]|nr:hypothetical protein F5B19DRAFT_450483 [Rostrohypoxylon terebratum]